MTSNRIGKATSCSVILLAVSLAGCGDPSPYAPVQGTVTLDGKPISGAAVAFTPKQKGGRRALGVTRPDGTFELSTLKPGDGALIGDHVVTVTAVDEVQNKKAEAMAEEFGSLAADMTGPSRKKVWRAPEKYSKTDSSGLTFTVEAGGDNQADFQLKSSP